MEGSANDGLLKPRIWHWLTPNVRNPKTSTVVQKIGQKVTYITGLHNLQGSGGEQLRPWKSTVHSLITRATSGWEA
jgi:hypothetical protein